MRLERTAIGSVSWSYAGEESLPLAQETTARSPRRGEGIWDPQARDYEAPKEELHRVEYAEKDGTLNNEKFS